jgi:putative DNA primase/helicase
MNTQNIPAEMRALKRWVCYRLVSDPEKPDKKPSKVPHQINGTLAKSNDPATWSTFEQACAAVDAGKFPGFSYALAAEDGLVCVDLDNARNPENWQPLDWAAPIIHKLASYTEVSPSGTGYHIFVRGTIPKASHKQGSNVELYAGAKIMATTGELGFDGYKTIESCPEELDVLFTRAEAGEFAPHAPTKVAADTSSGNESDADWKLVGEIFRKLNTRDVNAIEAAFRDQHPERYSLRNRAKGSRNGKTYFWYTIENFLRKLPLETKPPEESAPRVFNLVSGETVRDVMLEFLWPRRIPKGALTVLCGVWDVGKGLIVSNIVSALTTGKPWLDCENTNAPATVLYLSAEDSLRHTLVPRLKTAGADVTRIKFVTGTIVHTDPKKKTERMVALNNDLDALRATCKALPDLQLVVVDPISSYLGKEINQNNVTDVKSVLDPLQALAEELNITILAVGHFNKNSSQDAAFRLAGSHAFSSTPRAVWVAGRDKEEPSKRFFVCNKCNALSDKDKHGFVWEPIGKEHTYSDGKKGTVPLAKFVRASDQTADQAFGTTDKRETKKDAGAEFIKKLLADGEWHISTAVWEDCAAAGFKPRTLADSKQVIAEQLEYETDNKKRWYVRLKVAGVVPQPIGMKEAAPILAGVEDQPF